ncbi:CD36 family protein [Acanthamoeba castellanii str. Neff]|uniref:CD36 family protein n=1 Tax=Acanthamoeba castellanii (strain ATCC 30010 / Neff) TaxID=1257118 RepID=L8H9J7_ACACF|nr:CD36 family protein [Acanthamoeba castellanii str. Neff]ELR22174.1 CD36 family protein [Acanthamoeba castellanii str. Neff]
MVRKKTWCCLVVTALTAGVRDFIKSGIYDQVIIDSPEATNYKHWQNTYASDAPTLYIAAHFYNITNLEDVRNGALPIVKEVGPYVYWNKKDLIDIEWLEGGNKVKYNTMTRYVFLPELSVGPDTDVIVNTNPAYPGALSQAGGEGLLTVAITGPAIKLFFDFMWEVWIPDLVVQTEAGVLAKEQGKLTNGTNTLAFFDNWANQTKLISPEWTYMQVSLDAAAPRDALQSCNATLARRYGHEVHHYLAPGSERALLAWYKRARDGLVVPSLLQQWDVAELNDLAYLQWGTAQVTGGVSVTTLYPGTQFPASSELGVFWGINPAARIPANASKQLLNGPVGLFSALNLAVFIQATVNPINYNDTYVRETWGVGRGQADAFYVYFLYMLAEFSPKVMADAIAKGGGLFTTRTVDEWLMENTDPLLALLSPEQPDASILGNETTPEKARKRHGPDVVFTGKDDINQVQVYTQWFGQTVIEDVYAEPIPVQGVNDLGFFRPFLDLDSELWSWDSNYVRNMHLVPLGYMDHKGVNTIRYTLANETWAINATLYQTIQGFCNLTGFHNGTSLMLSNPHMYLADPKYTSLIEGQVPDPAADITRIDVEPNTGNVVWYDESVQINIYLDPSKTYFQMTTYNPDVRLDVIYPVVYIHMYAGLTEANADQVKDSLYLGFKAEVIIFWVLVGLGGFLLLLSLPSFFVLLLCLKADRRGSYFEFTRTGDGDLAYNPLINDTDE